MLLINSCCNVAFVSLVSNVMKAIQIVHNLHGVMMRLTRHDTYNYTNTFMDIIRLYNIFICQKRVILLISWLYFFYKHIAFSTRSRSRFHRLYQVTWQLVTQVFYSSITIYCPNTQLFYFFFKAIFGLKCNC